jgi:AraC-like DNA-binding protein
MNVIAETTDLETAEDILSGTYAPVRLHPRGLRRGLRLEQAALGPVQFHHVILGMDFDAEGDPLEALVFGELTSGQVCQESAGSDRHYGPGEVFLTARCSDPYSATVHDADVRLTVIDPAMPSQVADPAPGRAQVPVRFTGYEPVSAQAQEQWKSTCAYLREHLLADPEAAATSLVAASATRLLVATALATFPNNALTDPTTQDRHDSSPATLHRAVAFIDEHAHQDIALADIAAAAHVTIRAMQLAFRRHLNTIPSRYLRRVRLDHAHSQLVSGDPERDTVTAVAFSDKAVNPSPARRASRSSSGVTQSRLASSSSVGSRSSSWVRSSMASRISSRSSCTGRATLTCQRLSRKCRLSSPLMHGTAYARSPFPNAGS